MNIKEHIEAGHYPVDEKGRALVPMRNGSSATIYATDGPDEPIVGLRPRVISTWRASGQWNIHGHNDYDLLPPPPRKVKVTRWAVLQKDGCCWGNYADRETAKSWASYHDGILVELTGEYEEPGS